MGPFRLDDVRPRRMSALQNHFAARGAPCLGSPFNANHVREALLSIAFVQGLFEIHGYDSGSNDVRGFSPLQVPMPIGYPISRGGPGNQAPPPRRSAPLPG